MPCVIIDDECKDDTMIKSIFKLKIIQSLCISVRIYARFMIRCTVSMKSAYSIYKSITLGLF
ncbi:hypothetical protein BDA99DRAFT_515390 [Phascolomyces articulosus]|uniref:Uncharacterized protein n=1 Tax=Phascolomyces articulosus TaxID=60185 RepID=A0AAD5JX68_9FUNG|nr:hypothetical protein BDA99DRAFT_515390 [Phascolomyces articulosus]